MMFLTMKIFSIATFFLLFCCYSVFCFPSRPLNERSTELAWQAWLLVDDQQNQHKQSFSENFPRRRITPKSVFIAPTFSPESLPACADGYRPDSMGRCIKIIKIDEEAHLEFLLEKLNAQFGNYDDMEEESQENGAAAGPFQLNIPLNGPQDESPTKQLDIAIVVAPTNSNFGLNDAKTTSTTTSATTNVLGNSNVETKIPSPSEATLPLEGISNSKNETKTEILSSTTEKHATVITNFENTSTTTSDTTVEGLTDTTSVEMSTPASELTTLTSTDETTLTDQHALFFLQPPLYNSEHVQNGTKNVNDTPVTTNDNDNNMPSNNSLTTFLSNSPFVIDASIKLSNKLPTLSGYLQSTAPPSILPSEIDSYSTLKTLVRFPSDDQTTPANNIKFPDQFSRIRIIPQLRPNTELNVHTTAHTDSVKFPIYQTVFKGYLNPNGSNNLKGNEHFVFKDVTNLPSSLVSDPVNGNHNTHANYNQVFNHRNRDKHSNLWSIPPSWSQSSPKPIVLRFSHRAINSRHLLSEPFQPQTQKAQAFYREVPSEELVYLFGHNQNRNFKQNPR